MIIRLHESKLFTMDPADRFAAEYNVSPKMWNEIWKRHLSGYDTDSLAGYFMYKTGKRMSSKSVRRWIVRTEIHCRANHVMLMGVRVVQSEYFGAFEQATLDEVLRNLKYSGSKKSRTVV